MSWENAELALSLNLFPLYLSGPPAVGKSFWALRQLGETAMQMTLAEDLTVQELLGHWMPSGDRFVWHDAPAAAAMRKGLPLVLNEISRASGSVKDALLGILDSADVCRVTLPNGETLIPKKGFRVVATANHGPETLDAALASRFACKIHVTTPNPTLIDHLNKMQNNFGTIVERSFADPDRALDPRSALTMCKIVAKIGAEKAAALAFGPQNAKELVLAMKTAGVAL